MTRVKASRCASSTAADRPDRSFVRHGVRSRLARGSKTATDLGAGDGNRTRIASLEGWVRARFATCSNMLKRALTWELRLPWVAVDSLGFPWLRAFLCHARVTRPRGRRRARPARAAVVADRTRGRHFAGGWLFNDWLWGRTPKQVARQEQWLQHPRLAPHRNCLGTSIWRGDGPHRAQRRRVGRWLPDRPSV